MKVVYCIRHGKSTHNMDYQDRGVEAYTDPIHEDANLVPLGIQQAIKLSTEWKEINNTDLIITSPLLRTMDTTVHIFKNTKKPVIVLDTVREFPLGSHITNKRKPKSYLSKVYPEFDFTNMEEEATEFERETPKELKQRVGKTKEYIKNINAQKIALVSHSSFLKEFLQTDENICHCEPILFEL